MCIAIVIALVGACRSTRSTPRTAFAPTPFQFTYPAWAADSSHQPIWPYDNPATVEGIALGRRLFYETALSRDNDISGGSCHIQQHAFSDPRRFSIGMDGKQGTRNNTSPEPFSNWAASFGEDLAVGVVLWLACEHPYVALAVLLLLVLLMIWLVPKLVRLIGRMFDRVAGLGGVRSDMTGGPRGGSPT